MQTIIIGIFFLLHGLVHLLYAGQSGRLFELRPNMTWPDGSWIFSKRLDETTRLLASISLVLAALGFIAGGTVLVIRQDGWRLVPVGSAQAHRAELARKPFVAFLVCMTLAMRNGETIARLWPNSWRRCGRW